MDLILRGKRAVVTGASSDIGFSCAQALAAESVDVVLVSRDADRRAAAQFHRSGSYRALASTAWLVVECAI